MLTELPPLRCIHSPGTFTGSFFVDVRMCSFDDSIFSHVVTVFNLVTTHTPISPQSSNSVVFRLQPVYLLFTSL